MTTFSIFGVIPAHGSSAHELSNHELRAAEVSAKNQQQNKGANQERSESLPHRPSRRSRSPNGRAWLGRSWQMGKFKTKCTPSPPRRFSRTSSMLKSPGKISDSIQLNRPQATPSNLSNSPKLLNWVNSVHSIRGFPNVLKHHNGSLERGHPGGAD